MTHPNPATALARVVIDELAHRGVGLVVISPGSRSGALAIAASAHPDMETRVVIDERSAAFHALGAARASAGPVAVVSTSGSAPAHFLPAIVEADMSCVPLVAISADRPAELQGVGANQTIDQIDLYGKKVRAHSGIEAPDADHDGNVGWRKTVSGLVSAATGARPGPVHLNVRFREPTVPVTDDGRTRGVPYPFPTPRLDDSVPHEPGGDQRPFRPDLDAGRGLLIAGDGDYDRVAVAERASALGWPVLATALSGMRGSGAVGTYHHLLAHEVPPSLRPRTVVALGAIGPSPRLQTLVGEGDTRVRVDRWGRLIDPDRNATHLFPGDVMELLAGVDGVAEPSWSAAWEEADRVCRARLRAIVGSGRLTGAGVAAALNDVDWESLVVASSLPIREVDAHLERDGPVFANRGASGIDGFVSTALGVAAARPATLALSGDLSLLHDSNGFMHDASIDLTIVVVDNDGGGLFDSLPQAGHAPDYERLFVTPPHRDLSALARLHGLRYHEAQDLEQLRLMANEGLRRQGVDLIRVEVDRSSDLEMRAQLDG